MLLLLRRQAGSIWTDVLGLASSNGYPPCPDDEDWTQPRWIHFVSGDCRTCFYCDKETEANIIWALRKRICEPCQSSRWQSVSIAFLG
ncbi:hypothetical protein PENSPDRAFT_477383 [Peniophora sp. CONT]|nr:hypothetical protein PENSPDRAFT_477383 [Peniophora sp. CONT]